jgi:hypothetical protein
MSGSSATLFEISVLQRFQFLFFCEDSAPVGQVGVREFPITSHFSPITLVAACRAVFLVAIIQFLSRAIPPWTQIFLAKSSLAHSFPALYAKGDCKTQNEESSGETL